METISWSIYQFLWIKSNTSKQQFLCESTSLIRAPYGVTDLRTTRDDAPLVPRAFLLLTLPLITNCTPLDHGLRAKGLRK